MEQVAAYNLLVGGPRSSLPGDVALAEDVHLEGCASALGWYTYRLFGIVHREGCTSISLSWNTLGRLARNVPSLGCASRGLYISSSRMVQITFRLVGIVHPEGCTISFSWMGSSMQAEDSVPNHGSERFYLPFNLATCDNRWSWRFHSHFQISQSVTVTGSGKFHLTSNLVNLRQSWLTEVLIWPSASAAHCKANKDTCHLECNVASSARHMNPRFPSHVSHHHLVHSSHCSHGLVSPPIVPLCTINRVCHNRKVLCRR